MKAKILILTKNITFIIGEQFKLVVASYILNYAQSKEELLKMCQNIYSNLKPGGRFVSVNDNSEQPPESYLTSEKYGFVKSISEPLQEGTPITYTFTIPGEGKTFCFDNYYLSKATYEWAFRTAGFKAIHWHKPIVSPKGVREFGKEFWQDFLDYAPMIGIECLK